MELIGRYLLRGLGAVLGLLWEMTRTILMGFAHGTAGFVRRIAPWAAGGVALLIYWQVDPRGAAHFVELLVIIGIMLFGFRVMIRGAFGGGKKKKKK